MTSKRTLLGGTCGLSLRYRVIRYPSQAKLAFTVKSKAELSPMVLFIILYEAILTLEWNS